MLEQLAKIKLENKRSFAEYIQEHTGQVVDPNSLFDVQVKRLHEYKRQHLNALHILSLYNEIKSNPHADILPTTFYLRCQGSSRPTTWPSRLSSLFAA